MQSELIRAIYMRDQEALYASLIKTPIKVIQAISMVAAQQAGEKNPGDAQYALALACSYGIDLPQGSTRRGADQLAVYRRSEVAKQIRRSAAMALPSICRDLHELLMFAGYVNSMRGWGRTLKSAIQDFYKGVSPTQLGNIAGNRVNGFTQEDILRLARPAIPSQA